ncbi:MAG: hypothetical protein WD992_01475 [Candidatus Levyibacteriota bacterium]
MDKQLAGLDPKIQETYQRVMNTPTPVPPATTAPSPAANPIPAAEQPQVFTPQQATPAPPPVESANDGKKEDVVTIQAPETSTVNATNSQVFSSKKRAGKLSPIIMIMGIAVFFAVYTLVWVKVLGATLPFLP